MTWISARGSFTTLTTRYTVELSLHLTKNRIYFYREIMFCWCLVRVDKYIDRNFTDFPKNPPAQHPTLLCLNRFFIIPWDIS